MEFYQGAVDLVADVDEHDVPTEVPFSPYQVFIAHEDQVRESNLNQNCWHWKMNWCRWVCGSQVNTYMFVQKSVVNDFKLIVLFVLVISLLR